MNYMEILNNPFLIIPVIISLLIIILIPFLYFKTYRIEKYIRLRIQKATVIEIAEMSTEELRIGFAENHSHLIESAPKKTVLSIEPLNKSYSITIFRTTQSDSEWTNFCDKNVNRALNDGLKFNSINHSYENSEGYSSITLKCDENSISYIKKPYSYEFEHHRERIPHSTYDSILPLIKSYTEYKEKIHLWPDLKFQ